MAKKISAVVLAAGKTLCMERPKLTLPLGPKPLVRHVVDNLTDTTVSEVIVVLGAHPEAVRDALVGTPVRFETNAAFEDGVGSTIRSGIGATSGEAEAYLIIPGDLPLVESGLINSLIDRFESAHEGILVPAYQRVPGYPVIFDRRYRDQLLALDADRGVRSLLVENPRDVLDVHLKTNVVVFDVDSEEDYEELLGRMGLAPPPTADGPARPVEDTV